MSLAAGARLGPYEVLGPLGAGGMGEVYRARDPRLGRQVAIKILPDEVSNDPRRLARFETEARSLAALSHPNILAIHDVGRVDGRFYAVTELLDGETLRARMADQPVSWRKVAEVGAAIADGLAAAHAAGIVHRDLKPENVFLTVRWAFEDPRLRARNYAEPVSDDAVTLTIAILRRHPGRRSSGRSLTWPPSSCGPAGRSARGHLRARLRPLRDGSRGRAPFSARHARGHARGDPPSRARALPSGRDGRPPRIPDDRLAVPREEAGGPLRHGTRPRDRLAGRLGGAAGRAIRGEAAAGPSRTRETARGSRNRLCPRARQSSPDRAALANAAGRRSPDRRDLGSPETDHERAGVGRGAGSYLAGRDSRRLQLQRFGKDGDLGGRSGGGRASPADQRRRRESEPRLVPRRADARVRFDAGRRLVRAGRCLASAGARR